MESSVGNPIADEPAIITLAKKVVAQHQFSYFNNITGEEVEDDHECAVLFDAQTANLLLKFWDQNRDRDKFILATKRAGIVAVLHALWDSL